MAEKITKGYGWIFATSDRTVPEKLYLDEPDVLVPNLDDMDDLYDFYRRSWYFP